MEQKQGIVIILSDIKQKIDSFNREEAAASILSVKSIIERFYPKESSYITDIKIVNNELLSKALTHTNSLVYQHELLYCTTHYHRLLDSLLAEIEHLGLPSISNSKADNSFHLNVNQHQTQEQSQTTQLTIFLELIKDDITGRQFKDIVEIAKNNPDPKIAKPKIIDKLLSFGESVCASIVANILTNPSIWNSMIV